MSKPIQYFRHETNARNDDKLIHLRMKEGLPGMAIYWDVLEMIYEEMGYIMLSQCERIAFELRADIELVKRVILTSGLFQKDEEKFWSDAALEQIKEISLKSKKASESANKKWEKFKKTKVSMRTHSEGNANNSNIDINSNINTLGKLENPLKSIVVTHEELKKYFSESEKWAEGVAMSSKLTTEELKKWQEKFLNEIRDCQEVYPNMQKGIGHFVRWLKKELKSNTNGRNVKSEVERLLNKGKK